MANKFLSDEDKALFREHMRQVKPLNRKKNTHNQPETTSANQEPLKDKPPEHTKIIIPPKLPAVKQTPPVKPRWNETPNLSDYINEEINSESTLSYSSSSLSHKRFHELKKGQIPWEARLDLHGMTTEAAREALSYFIKIQTQNNKRCLLIVHGKGGHQGAPPVIKNLVNRWLPQFNQVLAYHSARAKDGGTGALYVLLKKNPLR